MTDSNRQIEVLEAELARLREVIWRLGPAAHREVFAAHGGGPLPYPNTETPLPSFFWLGKLATTLVVAAFVSGFFFLVHRTADPTTHAYGGVLALLLTAWGIYKAAPGRLASQGVLACGLGAGFMAVLDYLNAAPSESARLGMLCFIAASAAAVWLRQSEAVFGVTAVLACVCAIPDVGFGGAGGRDAALVLSLCVLLLAGPRSGTFPIWASCAAVFAQLALPMTLTVQATTPTGSIAGLLLIQAVTTLACVRYAARGGARVFNAALLAFVNALLCVVAVSSVLESAKGGTHALAMALTAVLFALLAGIAHGWRPLTTPIMACLATMSMVAAAMGVWSGLPEELFAPALAACAALLVLVYRQTASVLLRRLEAVSAAAAFGFCLFRLQLGGMVSVGPVTVPANWLNAFGTMFFLCFAATLHEKCFPGGPCREAHPGKSMARAAVAALVLLTITVLTRGADTALPFVLAAESLGMVGLGLLLFTPQIAVAAMFLLAPAHLCYHAFLLQPLPGFVTQPDFASNTAGLIAFTLVGAAAWERYLCRFHSSTTEWDHYAVVALPFLAAMFLGFTLLRELVPPSLLPAAMAALGLLCLAPSRLLRLEGLILAAVFCLAASDAAFGLLAYPSFSGPCPDSLFVPGATGMILMFVAAERLAAVLYPGTTAAPNRLAEAIRLLLCASAAAVAGVGLFAAAQGTTLGWGLTGAALLFVFLGWSSASATYSWMGTMMLFAVLALSFARVRGMTPGLETAAAVGIVCAMAVVRLRAGLNRFGDPGDDAD